MTLCLDWCNSFPLCDLHLPCAQPLCWHFRGPHPRQSRVKSVIWYQTLILGKNNSHTWHGDLSLGFPLWKHNCFSFLFLSSSVCRHFPFKFYGWKYGFLHVYFGMICLMNLLLVFICIASRRVWCWVGLLWYLPLCSGASVPGCQVRPLCFHPWRGHQSAGVWVSLACYLGILSFKHCILPKPFYLTTIFPCRKCWLQAPPGFLNCVWFIETDFQGCPHCLWTQVFNKRCPSLFPHLTS